MWAVGWPSSTGRTRLTSVAGVVANFAPENLGLQRRAPWLLPRQHPGFSRRKSQSGTLDSSSGQEDAAVVLSTAEVVGPSDSSPTPVRGRACLGECMGFAACPVCLLSGLASMWAGQ